MEYPDGPQTSLWSRLSSNEKNAAFYIAIFAALIVWGVYSYFVDLWRMHNLPHAKAMIERLWNEEIHYRRSSRTAHMAQLKFVRTYQGRSFDCLTDVEVGRAEWDSMVGELLDIVPLAGTCSDPLISNDTM
jgi:hypothetical protein